MDELNSDLDLHVSITGIMMYFNRLCGSFQFCSLHEVRSSKSKHDLLNRQIELSMLFCLALFHNI
ncbi:hypothetical protein GLYMA_01G174800v4 [Glycine max]|uniref:Uncharacterized protein n=1 Tax=Glycine max TaxID=3847 RepID=K7K4D7_SOYBN|nr:hypothetical protein GYH30_001902 [Glycine max]KHN36116.1 hypothetical protein glysoja_003239 [Glycine soja]KRH76794.1 hypothetical protein GLYMA_01G174800v4 [Glycine max]